MQINTERSAWPLAVLFITANAIASTAVILAYGQMPPASLYAAIGAAIGGALAGLLLTWLVSALVHDRWTGGLSAMRYDEARERFMLAAAVGGLGAAIITNSLMPAAIVAASTAAGAMILRERLAAHREAAATARP